MYAKVTQRKSTRSSRRVVSHPERTYPELTNTTDLGTFVRTVASKWVKPVIHNACYSNLECATSIKPQQYLEFALEDIRLGGARGRINAVANSKRAIDCQITGLLDALGTGSGGNFPTKMAKLAALGLVAPRILTKVARLRNALEHEWCLPDVGEAEDVVDVATLFLSALKPLFEGRGYLTEFWVLDESSSDHLMYIPNRQAIVASGIRLDSFLECRAIQTIVVQRGVLLAEQWIDSTNNGFLDIQAFLSKSRPPEEYGQLCESEARQILSVFQRV